MSFVDEQLERVRPLWDRMLSHRFLKDTRDGRIDSDTFATWMRQDYLFVEAALPFLATLIAKAPERHRAPLIRTLDALRKELALFEERADAVGVRLRDAPPSFTCHGYVQFLLATGYRASYPEGYTVLYVAEKAYFDSWKVVREGIDPESPWFPFVQNWSAPEFEEWVGHLGTELDALAASAGEAERERMSELFRLTTLYEIAFWEMAATGATWPGLDEGTHPGLSGTDSIWRTEETEPRGHAWEGVVRKEGG